ncbi:MAG TPA: putative porin [Prolixibacteraceae bacterium]
MIGNSGSQRSSSGSGKNKQKGGKAAKDTIVFKMRSFELVDDLTRIKEVKVDTTVMDFHIYHPPFKNSLSVESLGNIGNSYQSMDFFQRKIADRDFLFQMNYSDYGLWPGGVKFYDVTKPYTLLTYGQLFSNKPKGETVLKVFQTQNINQHFNFGFYYNSIGSSGKYLNQQSKDRSLGLFTSGTFNRYDFWFSIGKNSFDNQENGGLTNPKDIENPDIKAENIAVWLTDVSSLNNNFFASLTHQYKMGIWKEMQDKKEIFQKFIPRVALMHVFEYQKDSRIYTEADPNPSFNFGDSRGTVYFYGKDHVPYINGTAGSAAAPATMDKSGQNVISNRFVLKFLEAPDRKYTFGKQISISNDLTNTYFPQEEQTVDSVGVKHAPLGLTQPHNFSNTYIGASAYRTDGRFWSWNVAGKSYIQGRNALDYELSGAIEKPLRSKKDTSFIRIFANMSSKTPNYFFEHYYSNHYKWENFFDKTYTLRVGSSLDKPGWRLKASVNYSIISKYVFFNEKALPEQAASEFSVLQAMLNKDFKFGGLNIRNWAVFQRTSTSVYLALPSVSIRNSFYYENTYAKVLFYQLGIDTRYETAYNADQYAPAIGMFYRQSTVKIGDYAWIDAFINIKLKRTAFYIKYTNLATQFVKGGYYTSPGYAAAPSMALFGLSWSFYN